MRIVDWKSLRERQDYEVANWINRRKRRCQIGKVRPKFRLGEYRVDTPAIWEPNTCLDRYATL